MADDQAAAAVRSNLSARRAVLVTELADATSALAEFRALRAGSTDDDEHDPDGSPLSAQWSRLDGLHRAATTRLAEIDAALAQLDAGQYGICSRCGRPIPAGRLEVLPAASRCVKCADLR